MNKMMGLGKGLGSLIPRKNLTNVVSEENKNFLLEENKNQLLQIPPEEIEINPLQPRKIFNHEDLEELIESIKQYGIIQPLVVTKIPGGYQLIAGERRLRSAKIAGFATVPAIVRDASEQEKLELALIENVQRKDLNPIEKAIAYERLMSEFNLNQEQVADKMGISRSAVANTIRFLGLPEEVQKALADGKISEGHAKVIAGMENEFEQLEFLNKILQFNFTVRDAEKEMKKKAPARKSIALASKEAVIEEKEDILRSQLNTKVNIKKKGTEGQIVIDFYSEEELNSIIDQIVK
ncbi:ParB/RepB/Spo0J family partition protein [Patescibacteria group bacterium]|nr:ParB/RepB/Spo0J family partition protein [Patescibacteria group bacterium]